MLIILPNLKHSFISPVPVPVPVPDPDFQVFHTPAACCSFPCLRTTVLVDKFSSWEIQQTNKRITYALQKQITRKH